MGLEQRGAIVKKGTRVVREEERTLIKEKCKQIRKPEEEEQRCAIEPQYKLSQEELLILIVWCNINHCSIGINSTFFPSHYKPLIELKVLTLISILAYFFSGSLSIFSIYLKSCSNIRPFSYIHCLKALFLGKYALSNLYHLQGISTLISSYFLLRTNRGFYFLLSSSSVMGSIILFSYFSTSKNKGIPTILLPYRLMRAVAVKESCMMKYPVPTFLPPL